MERERAAAFWEANAETWTQHSRAGYDVYRDNVNTPGFLAMLPPVAVVVLMQRLFVKGLIETEK